MLAGALGERAREVVLDIAGALAYPGPRDADPDAGTATLSLGGGGIALFLAELARVTGDDRHAESAQAWLDDVVEQAAKLDAPVSLYGGGLGVGWLLHHLDGRLVDVGDAIDDVDDVVGAVLAGEAWPLYDLTDGVAGMGVYLLARLPRPAARDGLGFVVSRLAALADDHGAWFTPPEACSPDRLRLFPEGFYDLGLAHGNAGVVALLARLHATAVPGAGELLAAASAWLVSQRGTDDREARYPYAVRTDSLERPSGRIAWCYGDPGVALALVAAGQALGDEALVKEGMATARTAAARPVTRSGVVDAGICHGAAGLALMFGRLGLEDAARSWYEVLLSQRVPGVPVAGYRALMRRDGEDLVPEPKAGFLEGAAGVGLALLAGLGGPPYDWDAPLLTDVAPE